MSQSVGRPTRSPLYDPNAWLHYAEALEAENQQLREAAKRVDDLIFQQVGPDFENEHGWAAINRLRELAR